MAHRVHVRTCIAQLCQCTVPTQCERSIDYVGYYGQCVLILEYPYCKSAHKQ